MPKPVYRGDNDVVNPAHPHIKWGHLFGRMELPDQPKPDSPAKAKFRASFRKGLAERSAPKVYVDEPIWPFRGMMMCHMIADDVETLHAMAAKIGIARRWFQDPERHRYPHYDIAKTKRALAVKYGAVEIDKFQFVAKAKALIERHHPKPNPLANPLEPVYVYTDGSASFKAGNGGWAFVAKKGTEYAEIFGSKEKSSVGEMELMAIYQALQWLPLGSAPLRLMSDSQYAVNAINVWSREWAAEGWYAGNSERKHVPLLKMILARLDEHRKGRAVTIAWLPGHTKHTHNERADKLAGIARKEQSTNL